MVILILGILLWVIGFTMIIWSKRRKYYRSHKVNDDGYLDHLSTRFIDTVLWWMGILIVIFGCLMVGIQEYTNANWLLFLFSCIFIWLNIQIPIQYKK